MEALKEHMQKTMEKGIRLDGRKLDEFRPITIEVGSIATAEGSARIICGETDIIVGVKMNLGTPYPDKPDAGTLMVSAELRPISNPRFEAGPPSIESIETARVIDRTIRESKTIDEKSLCIKEGEQVWMVSVDICPINNDGNLIDVGGLGAIAALRNTKMPTIKDGKADYHELSKKGLKLGAEPIPVTVVKIGKHLLIDPTDDEMLHSDARLTIAVLADDSLCALQKGGDTPITLDEIEQMSNLAVKTAKKLRTLLR